MCPDMLCHRVSGPTVPPWCLPCLVSTLYLNKSLWYCTFLSVGVAPNLILEMPVCIKLLSLINLISLINLYNHCEFHRQCAVSPPLVRMRIYFIKNLVAISFSAVPNQCGEKVL